MTSSSAAFEPRVAPDELGELVPGAVDLGAEHAELLRVVRAAASPAEVADEHEALQVQDEIVELAETVVALPWTSCCLLEDDRGFLGGLDGVDRRGTGTAAGAHERRGDHSAGDEESGEHVEGGLEPVVERDAARRDQAPGCEAR